MMIDLVAQAGFSDLIQPLELIERQRVSVRHDDPVEHYSEPLLAKTRDRLDFPENTAALRNQQVLPVMGIYIGREHRVHGSGECAVEPVREHGLQDRALK